MRAVHCVLLCVGAGLVAACNVPAGGEEGAEAWGEGLSRGVYGIEPGEKQQGTELHGSALERVSFFEATLGTQPLSNLRLEKGGLAAEVRLYPNGTTPSLTACAGTSTGQARSCGFSSMGAGSCVPGTVVTLGGGACGTGSCTGDPVLRVCLGTQPCEYGSAGMLASGDDACGSMCPQVSFTCPSTGTYNVLAGPYNTSQSWSLTLVPSSGLLGWETLRGARLKDARLRGWKGNQSITLVLADILEATRVEEWESSGDTWLYQLRDVSSGMADLCGADGSPPYAVPVSGLFSSTGLRTESSTEFTFSCHSGVIAKCYRWGYQPWKDGPGESRMRNGHWSCTRMARADYCGNGGTHTQNGTSIVPWDSYTPQVIRYPDSGVQGMAFEGGWGTSGARCLSHWRWESMPASCTTLTPPIHNADGNVVNRCSPGQRILPDGGACANLCDTPAEAEGVFSVRMFNESRFNGADGGVPDGGP